MKDSVGNVLYDAWGGGTYGEDGVGGGGHLSPKWAVHIPDYQGIHHQM